MKVNAKRPKIPLTDEQKRYIDNNRDGMKVVDMAKTLGTTKYRIWNYFNNLNKEKDAVARAGFFNVNERENWIV